MKKSNIILIAIAVIASAFLLWLWYHLGFNKIDSPLDLIVSVVWWAVVAGVIGSVANAESKRQKAVRTVFVAEGQLFNSEKGTVAGAGVDAVQKVLEGLEYSFEKKDLPENAKGLITKVVKSDTFKVTESGSGRKAVEWKGEVLDTATGASKSFATREELGAILAA